MSGEQNWKIPTGFDDFMSHQVRRVGQEERRPSVRKASDLLGPGIAPYAVPIDDFDSDVAAFNGFFIAQPDADASPDDTKWWIGQTIADQSTGGWQMFSTFQPIDAVAGEHTLVMRSFTIAPDSPMRFYSDWQQVAPIVTPPVAAINVPAASGTFTSNLRIWRVNNVVHCVGDVRRPTSFSTSFTDAALVPYGYRPQIARTWPGSTYVLGSSTWYQLAADAAGGGVTPSAITIRMSAANANGAFLDATWLTDDPMP